MGTNRDLRGFYLPQMKTGGPVITRPRTANGAIGYGDPVNDGVNGSVARVADGPLTVGFDGIAMNAAANGEIVHVMYDLENSTWQIQSDDATITANVIGQEYALVQAAISAEGRSGCQLDGSTGGAGGVVRVVTMAEAPGNYIGTNITHNKLRVEFILWGHATETALP